MSSQQQSTGYKRRSSGKRGRRTNAPVPEASTDSTPVTAEAAVTTAEATTESRVRATRSTSAARAGATSRAARTEDRPSMMDRVVNTRRFEGLQKFIRDAWAEIKKVIWPDRETTRNLTLVVIAVSVVLGILLGGIDYVLFQLFEALP